MAVSGKYVCIECGHESPKWMGRCSMCGNWDTYKQISTFTKGSKSSKRTKKSKIENLKKLGNKKHKRFSVGFSEFDRVLGGGVVAGEVVLIGGEPGVGKTTLLLQVLSNVKRKRASCLYVSSEESLEQIGLHAKRLKMKENIDIICDDDIDSIIKACAEEKPKIVILDSIQTVKTDDMKGIAGGVGQVKECTNRITEFAKKSGSSVFLISHITKGGELAGPKVLEHIVDAVFYLEGDPMYEIRLLRGAKNRFGSTKEIGVFKFTKQGYIDAKNPSEVFLKSSDKRVGVCKGVIFEGLRAILVEVQALVSKSNFNIPQRVVSGLKKSKIQMISAIISKLTKANLSNKDVYVNIANGLSIDDAALDLAIFVAILSSYFSKKIDPDLVAIGEVSLTGQVHKGRFFEEKIRALKRLGYKNIIVPDRCDKVLSRGLKMARITGIADLRIAKKSRR